MPKQCLVHIYFTCKFGFVFVILNFLQSDGIDSPPDDSDADTWWCAGKEDEESDTEEYDSLEGIYLIKFSAKPDISNFPSR